MRSDFSLNRKNVSWTDVEPDLANHRAVLSTNYVDRFYEHILSRRYRSETGLISFEICFVFTEIVQYEIHKTLLFDSCLQQFFQGYSIHFDGYAVVAPITHTT